MRLRLITLLAALALFTGLTETADARHRRGRRWADCSSTCASVYTQPPCDCSCAPAYYATPLSGTAAPSIARPSLAPRTFAAPFAAAFPDVERPQPTSHTYNGCPPEGDSSGDTVLNMRKNRDDDGQYVTVPFDTILALPEPPSHVDRVLRENWGDADTQLVAQYEGTPVMVEGFLADARQEKGEKCNCNGGAQASSAPAAMCDVHVWLTSDPDKNRTRAVVVEVTPRGKSLHPSWRETALKQVATKNIPVRISGWLMFDQDHYEQLNHTRGTLWEIHPIMQIEVQKDGNWVKLDDL
jgi:hypothetical protein